VLDPSRRRCRPATRSAPAFAQDGVERRADRGSISSHDPEQRIAGADLVAGVELAAAAVLRLTVDERAALGQERLRLAAGVDQPGQLEQLAQPDHVAADLHLAHAQQRRINHVRYWLPLVAALGCLIVATKVSAIIGFVLIVLAFGLVIEVSTKLFENAGKTGSLNDHRQ
jgi:hypothetical protein